MATGERAVTQRADWIPDSIDVEIPSAARMYDYLLGGSHNFAVDRALVEKGIEIDPEGRRIAIMNRAFLRRAVLFLIEQGIRQFLDLGSGIPTVGNVHEVAQQVDPECRVVYVDVDPVAVAHSQLMLAGNERVVILRADVTDVPGVLGAAETRSTLDFSQPVGILAVTIGHYISPEQDPVGVFGAYRDAVVPGSYLAITHITDDFTPAKMKQFTEMAKKAKVSLFPRTRAEVLDLLAGFELVEPGLTTTSQWRPDRKNDFAVDPAGDRLYAAVGRNCREIG
jgi:S-adenosyl methyltransferase